MCWKKEFTQVEIDEVVRPDWITLSAEECADETLDAATIHYTWMTGIEEGWITPEQQAIGGDYAHHEHWFNVHQQTAWYAAPEYTEDRLEK